MFLVGLIIGSFIGGFITLILYSCIIIGRQKEEYTYEMEDR